MNKTTKILATLIACTTLAGTCLAAPHGGHNYGPAPMHHRAPPPPPRHEMHHHHHDRHHHDAPGIIAFGAAVIGGIVGGILGR